MNKLVKVLVKEMKAGAKSPRTTVIGIVAALIVAKDDLIVLFNGGTPNWETLAAAATIVLFATATSDHKDASNDA